MILSYVAYRPPLKVTIIGRMVLGNITLGRNVDRVPSPNPLRRSRNFSAVVFTILV